VKALHPVGNILHLSHIFWNFLKPEIAFSDKQCKVNPLLVAIIFGFLKRIWSNDCRIRFSIFYLGL